MTLIGIDALHGVADIETLFYHNSHRVDVPAEIDADEDRLIEWMERHTARFTCTADDSDVTVINTGFDEAYCAGGTHRWLSTPSGWRQVPC